jgi:hypothetical protein
VPATLQFLCNFVSNFLNFSEVFMWVFTQNGFLSAVRTSTGSGDFKVRARDLESLRDLAVFAEAEIIATPLADYPYRVIVSELVLGGFLMNEIAAADYTNYKSRASVTRGTKFAHACSSVWSTMHEIEDEQARSI